jgi:hypothetical protein
MHNRRIADTEMKKFLPESETVIVNLADEHRRPPAALRQGGLDLSGGRHPPDTRLNHYNPFINGNTDCKISGRPPGAQDEFDEENNDTKNEQVRYKIREVFKHRSTFVCI